MSQEKTMKNLEDLGFSKIEAQIYLLLGRRGSQRAKDIVGTLKVNRQRLYEILKGLEKRGLINASLEHPAKFSALPFEKMLDLFVKSKMEEAQLIDRDKTKILSDWQSIAISETDDQSPKFTVLEGRNYIYPRLKQMIEQTKSQLSIISTVQGMAQADQFGLLETAFNHTSEGSMKFRFLTEISEENLNMIKGLLRKMPKMGLHFEGRTPELGLKLMTRMIVRDDMEAAFFVNQEIDNTIRKADDVCLWTNSPAIVNSFKFMFDNLWQNSADLKEKIVEIETGKSSTKTCVFCDLETAKKKYNEEMENAKKEIIIVTSSAGLLDIWKNPDKLKAKTENGVSVRIMSPIIRDNLNETLKLSEFCKVRHVPESFLSTTIIDGQHLFQFKNELLGDEKKNELTSHKNTFYTNDVEYANKMQKMLINIWNHAQIPSPIMLKGDVQQPTFVNNSVDANKFDKISREYEKILGVSRKTMPQLGKITEKEVLDKIANATRIPARDPKKDAIRLYGTMGIAIIYPPKNLDLPNFIIQVFHNNNTSSFGADNFLRVFVETSIANQRSYLPTAFVTDNPLGYKFRKIMQPQNQNTEIIQLLKKNELNVTAKGNRLFAGWTTPIPLLPPKYILPSACIIFEGYGNIKSYISEITAFGRKTVTERNSLEAFVTLMHPSSSYNAPGPDALLHREMIMTAYPQSDM